MNHQWKRIRGVQDPLHIYMSTPASGSSGGSRARLVICEIQNSRFHAFVFSPPSCSTDTYSHPLSSSNEHHVCVAAGRGQGSFRPSLPVTQSAACANTYLRQYVPSRKHVQRLAPFLLYLIPMLASGLTTRRRFRRVWRSLGNLDGADQVSWGQQRLRRPSFGFGTSLPQVTNSSCVGVGKKKGRAETVVT